MGSALAGTNPTGRAVSAVCRRRDPGFRRINLEIQGNTDAFLHAHVTPRTELVAALDEEQARRHP